MTKKTELTKEDIVHLAELAKLHLTDEEMTKYQKQLGETVDYVKNLNELKTDNVKPTHSVVNLKNVTFEDAKENKRKLSTEEVLLNAKKKKENEFVVERIM